MGLKDLTISSIFLLPTLKLDKEELKSNDFINAYSIDKNRDIQYENALYLLFKPTNIDKFKDFLDKEYSKAINIIDDYNYDDYIVLVYALDEKWKEDVALIKKGQYSKVSDEFKEMFPKTITIVHGRSYKEEISLQWKIFSKDDMLRQYWEGRIDIEFAEDLEVWWGWENIKETMDIK